MPLLSEKHLRRALRQCGRRASAPGTDRMTWAALRRDASQLLPRLVDQLADGSWQPGALRTVLIPTYTGKQLPVAIPPVVDRLVHRAMRNAMQPIFEARAFADWVSGLHPHRNRISTLRRAAAHVDVGYRWVADIDVVSVSEGATVEEVIDWIAPYVHDGTFLVRVGTALAALPFPIAPGSGLAPLLNNLRLSQVDRELDDLRVVRFADNYCAFTRSQTEAREAFGCIRRSASASTTSDRRPVTPICRVRKSAASCTTTRRRSSTPFPSHPAAAKEWKKTRSRAKPCEAEDELDPLPVRAEFNSQRPKPRVFKVGDKAAYDPDAEQNRRDQNRRDPLPALAGRTFTINFVFYPTGTLGFEGELRAYSPHRFKPAPTAAATTPEGT